MSSQLLNKLGTLLETYTKKECENLWLIECVSEFKAQTQSEESRYIKENEAIILIHVSICLILIRKYDMLHLFKTMYVSAQVSYFVIPHRISAQMYTMLYT